MRKGLLGTLLLAFGLFTARAMFSVTPESKIDSVLLRQFDTSKTTQAHNSSFPILVILKEQADVTKIDVSLAKETKGMLVYNKLTEVSARTQQPIIDIAVAAGLEYQSFYITNMVAIFGASEAVILELAGRSDVEKVVNNNEQQFIKIPSKEARVAAQPIDDEPETSENITAVRAPKVWTELKITGKGIVVAGQDTGYEWNHPALKTQYRGWNGTTADHNYNWHDAIKSPISIPTGNRCGYDLKVPCDDGDHGSHTMGTIVGDDGKGNAIGMAPEAKWIGCRNMDEGNGRPSTYIDCFQFLLAPYPLGGNAATQGRPELAPHVINNSWGCPRDEGCTGTEVLPAMTALKAAGVMMVVSAGNEGSSCSTIQNPPAYHSDVTFTVGAVNHRNWKIAYFSSRGPSTFDQKIGPDITAPGVDVRSSVPGGGYEGVMWSGTSMAGPHVAGLVALLWSAKPSLIGKIDETSEILRKTARPTKTTEKCGNVGGDKIPNNTFGYGIIDAYDTVKSVL